MNFADFLSFRNMITPLIIQVIYFVGLAANALAAIILFFTGMFHGFGGFIAGTIGAILMLVVGSLMIRVYCELLILAFKIYEELKAIRTGTPPGEPGFPVTPTAPMPETPGAPIAPPTATA